MAHHYITKRTPEFLIGNSRFLIYIFVKSITLLYGIKESCLFVTKFVDTLGLNN